MSALDAQVCIEIFRIFYTIVTILIPALQTLMSVQQTAVFVTNFVRTQLVAFFAAAGMDTH